MNCNEVAINKIQSDVAQIKKMVETLSLGIRHDDGELELELPFKSLNDLKRGADFICSHQDNIKKMVRLYSLYLISYTPGPT